MARYILIDNCSGYIWGDSADIGGKIVTGTPLEVAAALDAHVGTSSVTIYEEVGPYDLRSNEAGYDVYQADIDGSECVGVIHDGQDRETIEEVRKYCDYVTTIRCVRAEG